jgi:hypothetical protein
MPPKKKTTKVAGQSTNDVVAVTIDQLDDVLANIFGWLRVQDIMGKRCVCKKWKEAAKKTIVPLSDFYFVVNNVRTFNAMGVMTRALPNLQQIELCDLGYIGWHRWSDGEDPNEEYAAEYAHDHWITHDIEIISNFSKLRVLKLWHADLNGRYPFLFSSFPLLQKLSIGRCNYLKWDLEMLAGFPLLKELDCYNIDDNECVTGNINSLRVLKDTLESVRIEYCDNVEGNFMDLADFPHLKLLRLQYTAVTGDIRDIGENCFTSLERLILPQTVYGGRFHEFQRISDAPDLMRAVYLLKKRRPALLDIESWFATLSDDSPDWYEAVDEEDTPPFDVTFVQAGTRIGYRWETSLGYSCEVNWLDPEPEIGSSGCGKYTEDLQVIQRQIGLYKGFHQPPTEEEYRRLMGWESESES